MSTNLADLVLHIDENLSADQRGTIEEILRSLDVVVRVHNSDKKPHFNIIEYDQAEMDSQRILKRVTDQGAHAELVGL